MCVHSFCCLGGESTARSMHNEQDSGGANNGGGDGAGRMMAMLLGVSQQMHLFCCLEEKKGRHGQRMSRKTVGLLVLVVAVEWRSCC